MKKKKRKKIEKKRRHTVTNADFAKACANNNVALVKKYVECGFFEARRNGIKAGELFNVPGFFIIVANGHYELFDYLIEYLDEFCSTYDRRPMYHPSCLKEAFIQAQPLMFRRILGGLITFENRLNVFSGKSRLEAISLYIMTTFPTGNNTTTVYNRVLRQHLLLLFTRAELVRMTMDHASTEAMAVLVDLLKDNPQEENSVNRKEEKKAAVFSD